MDQSEKWPFRVPIKTGPKLRPAGASVCSHCNGLGYQKKEDLPQDDSDPSSDDMETEDNPPPPSQKKSATLHKVYAQQDKRKEARR